MKGERRSNESAKRYTGVKGPQWNWVEDCVVPLLLVVALLGTVAILAYLHQATRSETGPWPLGEPDARWTITEYADLECPYCKTYTPDLKRWVGRHPQVNLQWHHVPLPGHGQAAVHEARLVQCAGVHGGREAFWTAIDQVLAKTGSNGLGFTGPLDVPNVKSDVLELCADTDPGIALLVEQQRIEARKHGIQATPTVEITDNRSGRSLTLEGPADEATLLSAMDWLDRQASVGAESTGANGGNR